MEAAEEPVEAGAVEGRLLEAAIAAGCQLVGQALADALSGDPQ